MWFTGVKRKILLSLIALGLLVFVFNILFLPTWAFVDAGTHLGVVERMMAGEPFELIAGDLFPFWYYSVAGFFSVFSFVPVFAWNKVWALVVFIPTLLLFWGLSKKILPKHYLLAVAFFTGNWWVLNFSSIAYIEPFLGLLLVLFFTFFQREQSGSGSNRSALNYLAMLGIVVALALTKLTGFVLAPVLLALMLYLYWFKTRNWQLVGYGYLLLYLAMFFIGLTAQNHKLNGLSKMFHGFFISCGRFALNPFDWMPQFRRMFLAVLNFPPNHCLNLMWFGEKLELVQGIFFYLFLPFALVALLGWIKSLDYRKPMWIAVAIIAFCGFGIVFQQWLSLTAYILPRYTVPVWGLLGLLFAKGFSSLESEKIKKVVFVSFALFCVYSFAYTGFSTYRYWKVQVAFEPGLEFVEQLPGKGRFAVSYVPSGKINSFKGKETIGGKLWRASDLNEFGNKLREASASHVFIGCYREMLSPKLFELLQEKGKTRQLYKDSCSQVWRIDDYNFAVVSRELSVEEFKELTEPELEGATGVKAAPKALDKCH